jgi:2-haloacid dehalogenase
MNSTGYSAGVTVNPVAILFDLQGTCVDFYTSVIDTCRRVDAGRHPDADWDGLLTEWRRHYARTIGYGAQEGKAAPWRSARAVYREGLAPLLPKFGLTDYGKDDIEELSLAFEEQRRPWPDVAPGLERLSTRYTLGVLTNVDVPAMTRTVKAAGLRFDLLLSVQMFQAFKPDPRAYLGAAEWLALPPEDIMLVACHVYDVQGAHEQGFQTAFIPRPDERRPGHGAEPAPSYGLTARDFLDLADQLGC